MYNWCERRLSLSNIHVSCTSTDSSGNKIENKIIMIGI
jgi:hypothetical protein